MRVGVVGSSEGGVLGGDVVGPERLQEHRVPQATAVVGDRLVHDVPRMRATAEMVEDGVDVVVHVLLGAAPP